MDVRVFNLFAPSNSKSSLSSHEREKMRVYCRRVTEVVLGTFRPLVLSLTGGTSKEATVLTNDWPPFFLTNGNSHVVSPSTGYASLWGFAC